MPIGMLEKQIRYDNPCAPIVKFACSDDDDMFDDQLVIQPNLEQSLKTFSLEDLVQSFDNTINSCFSDQNDIIESNEQASHSNLLETSKTWSDLIENLRTSLRHDLKLPPEQHSCKSMPYFDDEDFICIDDLNEDEEEDLRDKLDMHSIILSSTNQLFLTAEQVISEIDFMLKDLTPDSGFGDQSYLELDLKTQTISSLNQLIDELNHSIQDLSSILVEELANRENFEEEKEIKNRFIELLFHIQNKRHQYQSNDKRRLLITKSNTYLTTVIPYDPRHSNYLSTNYLQCLNKILHAINEDSSHLPELLTNYILKVLCPC